MRGEGRVTFWSVLGAVVLAAALGLVAFGRSGGVSSIELISTIIVLLLALALMSSRTRRGRQGRSQDREAEDAS